MQTILEVVSVLLDLLAVDGASFVISADLEALLADLGESHTNLLSLVEHGLLVGVEPGVPLLGEVKILASARGWISSLGRCPPSRRIRRKSCQQPLWLGAGTCMGRRGRRGAQCGSTCRSPSPRRSRPSGTPQAAPRRQANCRQTR